ncbi:MAG: aspartate aminotransferase family protein [Chthoniobacterales bacterium]
MPAEQRSAVQQKSLFDDEQEFIAPGLQTIALLSQVAIDHGNGCTLTDVNGRTYLDLNAGVSVASLGHAHPRHVAALIGQLKQVSVGSFTSAARAELVRLIAELAPGDLKRTQFFSGGAEAVEAAIRLARSYTKSTHIVGFTGGFHGKTAGVLPISDIDWKREVGPLPPDQHIAIYPDVTTFGGTAAECAAASLDSLRRVIEEECGGRAAAIILEPIQGTAGNIIPPDGFLRSVRDVANEYGALMIADEMITGFGRTGAMFGCNHDSVVPDIMTVGKGMGGGFPVSAVISTDEIMSAKPFSLPSASSSSYGGNPLAAAAALVTIQTIVEDDLAQNAASTGELFRDGLRAIEKRCGMIANIRGRGLLIGFDLVDDRKQLLAKPKCIDFFKRCLARGLIMMSYTPRVRVHPPLILTRHEAEQALATIDDVLSEMTAC